LASQPNQIKHGSLYIHWLKQPSAALFYLFYNLLLSKDTFNRFNRIALLSLLLIDRDPPLHSPQFTPNPENELSRRSQHPPNSGVTGAHTVYLSESSPQNQPFPGHHPFILTLTGFGLFWGVHLEQ
jgi:hypothetical protein